MPRFLTAALYKFVDLPDCGQIQPRLLAECEAHRIKGTLLLAREGINGTIAGSAAGVAAATDYIRNLPGFVKVEDERTFLVPDFTGNFFFMTLGNLQLNPRAGVLFIDFDTGDLLTLTGTAEVVWSGDELKAFDGAERAWRFRVESGWRLREALPLRWAFRDFSPHSTLTGTWAEADAKRSPGRLARHYAPRTRVVLIDGLTAAVARTLPTWRALCGQGLTVTVEVGFPTVSLPVEPSTVSMSVTAMPPPPDFRRQHGKACRVEQHIARLDPQVHRIGRRPAPVVDAVDEEPSRLDRGQARQGHGQPIGVCQDLGGHLDGVLGQHLAVLLKVVDRQLRVVGEGLGLMVVQLVGAEPEMIGMSSPGKS